MTIAHRVAARTTALLAVLLGAALLTLSLSPAAEAASGYRFWGYFQLTDGKWAMSTKGAAQTKPADGAVEGWRYALAGQTDSRTPRDAVSFDEICNTTKAKEGQKRVGLVLDFGRRADAASGTPPKPVTTCAVAPADATGAQVLSAGLRDQVRVEKGMTCGILGWPRTGCSDEVKEVPAAAAAKDTPVDISGQLGFSGTTPTGPTESGTDATDQAAPASDSDDSSSNAPLLIGGGVVLVLLLGGALVLAQRRRKSVESA